MTVFENDSPIQLDILEIAGHLNLDKGRMLEFISSGIVAIPNLQQNNVTVNPGVSGRAQILSPLSHRSGRLRLTQFSELKPIQYGRVRH
ncbi:hypothetical protein [Paenibacillus nasutitermitis]|uniref:Uncharacterized protein n=1 Tax=Paenibacillus nasutitermitis TaxID=1652958 RepID=A0A917DWF9_9BACL|nr:hypothetical protein [Paenibacillus nasutitermitis]GGD75205.1 hypothetical protein GCM10010911_36410 [Paenibacillus nasutitermitis]